MEHMKTKQINVEMTVTINLSKEGYGIDLSECDLRDRLAEFIETLAGETEEEHDDGDFARIDTEETDASIAVWDA